MLSFEKLQKNLWLMSSLYSLGSKTNKVQKNSAKVLPNIWKFGLYEKYFSLIRFFFILITIFKLLQRTIHFLFVTSRMMALVVLKQKTSNEKFLEIKSTDEIVLNNEHQYLWNNRITRCSFVRLFFVCARKTFYLCASGLRKSIYRRNVALIQHLLRIIVEKKF